MKPILQCSVKFIILSLILQITYHQKYQQPGCNNNDAIYAGKYGIKESQQNCDDQFSTDKKQFRIIFCLVDAEKINEHVDIRVINLENAQYYDVKIYAQNLINFKITQFHNPVQLFEQLKQNIGKILIQDNGSLKYPLNVGKFERMKTIITKKRKVSPQIIAMIIKDLTNSIKMQSNRIQSLQSEIKDVKQTMGTLVKHFQNKIITLNQQIKQDYKNEVAKLSKEFQSALLNINSEMKKQRQELKKLIQRNQKISNNQLNSHASNISAKIEMKGKQMKILIDGVKTRWKQTIEQQSKFRFCFFHNIMNAKYCRMGKSAITATNGFRLSYDSSKYPYLFTTSSQGSKQKWTWYQLFDGTYAFVANIGKSLRIKEGQFLFQSHILGCEKFIRIRINDKSIFKSSCEGSYLTVDQNGKAFMSNVTDNKIEHSHLWHLED